MYLLSGDDSNGTFTTDGADRLNGAYSGPGIVEDNDPSTTGRPPTVGSAEGARDDSWIVYTVIAATILILIIVLVILYDLCNRWRTLVHNEQEIVDGGPPLTPTHCHRYSVSIYIDAASPSFDQEHSMIRIELLDQLNQYITSFVIPASVCAFNTDQAKMKPATPNGTKSVSAPDPEDPFNYNNPHKQSSSSPFSTTQIKSMTAINEQWKDTAKSNVIKFTLIRRSPIINLSYIRIIHDCFKTNAHITLKSILVRDESKRQVTRFELKGKQLRGVHPCPPTGAQVYRSEPPRKEKI